MFSRPTGLASQDFGGNLKPTKDKFSERIDGIVAQREPQPVYSVFFA
jgi:hypothetical protein